MNNSNNNTEGKDKIKLEYVNPLNPNEILKVKDEMNQPEVVNNETVIQNETNNIDNVTDSSETTVTINKTKGKNKLLLVILVLVVLAIILAAILIAPKVIGKKEEEPKPVVQAPSQEEVKIDLNNIVSNATNNSYYRLLTKIYTVNISNVNNSIVFDLNSIDQTTPITKQFVFTLNNRDLSITFNKLEDNQDKLNALYAILDSIGQYHGHEVDEVGNYLYSVQNNYNFNTNGITSVENIDPTTGLSNNTVDISINIDTSIATTNLNSIVFTLDELNLYKDVITNSTTSLKKGDLLLYTNNSDVYTIIIGQRKELTNNTYDTITNVIELLYPEEINDFKSKFTSLSTISFDKYKITVDPVLDANTYPEYQNNYKFVLIEIIKQAATM